MTIKDTVYVINWGRQYSDLTKWNNESNKRENIFPIKTELPDYCGIEHHWKYNYEPNLTLKGTVNKREPRKLVSKEPIYKNYKWEVLEIFKHPKAGQYYYTEEERATKGWGDGKYTEENLLLLASTHSKNDRTKCYIVISESGVSKLTPEQFEADEFDFLIKVNLKKWDRNKLESFQDKEKIPKEIKSVFYDENDDVLFGSSMTKGLVSYHYLESKFSVDDKAIYLGSSILCDGTGNATCPDKTLIKSFSYIKSYIDNLKIIKYEVGSKY